MAPKNNAEEHSKLNQQYSFLTSQYFSEILKTKIHDGCSNVTVRKFHLNAALPSGENFCSQMVRATIEYSLDDEAVVRFQNVILKLCFTVDSLNAKVNEINAFGKEIIMFTQILPQVYALLTSIGDDVELSAKCYASGADPNYLCFEDLVARGYRNVDKHRGLTAKHLHPLFTKLAKYHAGTAKMLLDNQINTQLFEDHPLTSMTGFTDYIQTTIELSTEQVVQWEGFEEIGAKLKRLDIEATVAGIKNGFEREEFLVITHGDLWSNNTMFKMAENGDVEDVVMVDFQLGHWASPIHDITYCIYMSANYQITEEDLDLVLQSYHKVLLQTLIALDYPVKQIPTLRQMRADMFRRFYLEIFHMFQMNAFRDKEMTFDIDILIDSSDAGRDRKRKWFARPEFRKYCEPWLRYMDRKGLLD